MMIDTICAFDIWIYSLYPFEKWEYCTMLNGYHFSDSDLNFGKHINGCEMHHILCDNIKNVVVMIVIAVATDTVLQELYVFSFILSFWIKIENKKKKISDHCVPLFCVKWYENIYKKREYIEY